MIMCIKIGQFMGMSMDTSIFLGTNCGPTTSNQPVCLPGSLVMSACMQYCLHLHCQTSNHSTPMSSHCSCYAVCSQYRSQSKKKIYRKHMASTKLTSVIFTMCFLFHCKTLVHFTSRSDKLCLYICLSFTLSTCLSLQASNSENL